ncbi:MAG: hypothetical protein AAB531_02400 [Patescibacteria group bacterium]
MDNVLIWQLTLDKAFISSFLPRTLPSLLPKREAETLATSPLTLSKFRSSVGASPR